MRTDCASTFFKAILSGLNHACDKFGYCHSDLRADNVIVVNDTYIIIDWALARKENELIHNYSGGLVYFHDALVNAYYDEKQNTVKFLC